MRTETLAAAPAPRGDAAADAAASTQREGGTAFEAALQRAGRGGTPARAGRGTHDEDRSNAGPPDDALLPPALPVPALTAAFTRPPEPAPTPWAPQAARGPATLSQPWQSAPLQAAASEGRWQLQILQTGLPVQTVEVQAASRTPQGTVPMHVVLTARADAQHSEPSARLRQRLATRAGGAAGLQFRPPQEHEE